MRSSPRIAKLATWAVYAQLVGLALFLVPLFIGESSRVTLIALYVPRQPLLVAAVLAALLAPLTPRRRVLVPVQIAVCLVVLFPVMGLRLNGSRTSDRAIHVTSYNVHFGKDGRPQLLDELVAHKADILVVQAAYDTLGDRLRERLPGQFLHQDGELLMTTRFPVREAVVPISPRDTGSPMYGKYVIETPYGALRLYNVHPYSPRHALLGDDDTGANISAREMQIASAVDAARSDVPPFLVIGDTNLPGLSGIGRRHLGKLHDAFDEVGFGFGYTFSAKRPWMRLDRALAGDRVKFLDIRVGDRGASDHRPIFVDLEIE